MPFEGVNNVEEKRATPLDRMAEERRKKASEEAMDAEVIDSVDDDVETLNLENIEHLQSFMEAAEDAYMDAMRWEWKAYHESYQSLNLNEVEGREVFEVLRDMLDEIRTTIDELQNTNPPDGGYTSETKIPITHEQVEHLQELYDKVLLFRDTVEHAYSENEVTPANQEVLDPESAPEAPEPEKPHETIDATAEDVTPVSPKREGPTWESEQENVGEEHSAPAEVESAETTPESLLQEFREAIESVHQDQFIAEVERETVRALEQQFGRQIEAGDSEKARQTIQNLRSIIESQSVNVNPELIPERTKRILERVEAAKTSNPDVYMTAVSLAENIDRIKEETEDEARVANAYRNLERHALEHESEWLTVCGMQVPKAGPDGIFGARSFREGLMLSLDRHPALISSPQRKMFVGKIVGMLREVPNSGLTEEQVSEISRLARIIDAPKRLIEARQSGPANETSFDIPQPVEDDMLQIKRGDLVIESGEEEQAIEISVAEGAEQYISHPEPQQHEVVEETKEATQPQEVVETAVEDAPAKVRTIHGVIVPVGGAATKEIVRIARSGLIELSDIWGEEYPSTEHKRALEKMIQILQYAPLDTLPPEETEKLADLADILASSTEDEQTSTSESESSTIPVVNEQDIEQEDSHGYISELEENDPVNIVEPKAAPRPVPERYSYQEVDENSLSRTFLSESRYTNFMSETYGSPEKFERFLQAEIARIDESASDSIEKWLGETHASTFGFLQDMSIEEWQSLRSMSNQDIRAQLKSENVKYESFTEWDSILEDLMSYAGANPDMKISELFARGIIEAEMTYYDGDTDAGQFTL